MLIALKPRREGPDTRMKPRITRKWVAIYLENVALVDAMKAEVVVAAMEGRIDEDAYRMLVEAYAGYAKAKSEAVGGG